MRPFPRYFSPWFALLSVLLFAPSLLAGTVRVEDASDKLAQPAETSLVSKGSSLPFDALVIVTSDYANAADLDRYVGRRVDSPNKIVVAVDPVHRRTSVHFGTGAGVPSSQFKNVEQAGVRFFKSGDYGAGVEAILDRAREVNTSNASPVSPAPLPAQLPAPLPASPPPSPSPAPTSSSSSGGMAIFVLLGVIAFFFGIFMIVMYALWRAFRAMRSTPRGYDERYPSGGGGYSSGHWNHGQQQSGVGSVVTHGAAAVGGAAVGYMAGRHFSESDSNSSSDSPFNNSSSSSSWDSSSSSGSSWDSSSSSSSSSYDAGGSTSDWSSSSSDSSSSGGGSTSDW
ncbi:MAG TPA: hypothetical protein PK156_41585 [Polyangium sp.]|nr:hypothetical protein [Polyangium sp.]